MLGLQVAFIGSLAFVSVCSRFPFFFMMTLFSSPSYTTMPRNRAVCSQQTRVLRERASALASAISSDLSISSYCDCNVRFTDLFLRHPPDSLRGESSHS